MAVAIACAVTGAVEEAALPVALEPRPAGLAPTQPTVADAVPRALAVTHGLGAGRPTPSTLTDARASHTEATVLDTHPIAGTIINASVALRAVGAAEASGAAADGPAADDIAPAIARAFTVQIGGAGANGCGAVWAVEGTRAEASALVAHATCRAAALALARR